MATISDITNAASYRGTPELGGAIGTGVTIDPSPLARLATFAFYRDRDLFEKKKVDDANAANKIAALSAFDINSPLKEYTDDLKGGIEKVKEFLRSNPNALYYDKDPKGFQKLNEMYGELEIKRKHATVNDVLYNRDKAVAESLPAGPKRDAAMALLDLNAKDLFNEGVDKAYGKQIRSSPDLKPDAYVLPAIPDTQVFTIDRNANDLIVNGKQYADLGRLKSLAFGKYLELDQAKVDVNSKAFKELPEAEQKRQIIEAAVTDEKLNALNSTAKTIDALVKEASTKFIDAQGHPIPIEDVPEAELDKAGGTVAGYLKSVKQYNKAVEEVNKATGRNFEPISLSDGAKPEELIQLDWFNKNGGTLFKQIKPEVHLTDNEIQLKKINSDAALGWAGLNWDKEKFATTLKGPDQTKSAAVAFAEGLVNDIGSLGSITTNDGGKVLTPDDVRKLTADQRKWLGQELPAERDPATGAVTQSAGISPLELADDEVMEITKDGKIFVMKSAKFDPIKKQYIGKWDNTKSTTVDNVTRLVLNEENVKSGSKEINNYVPLDIRGRKPQIYVTESGGSQSASGSQSSGGGGSTKYYNDPNNVQSTSGDEVTYKNGSVWKISGNKMKQIK